MAEYRLLDCTLRDGGYVNNWKFGRNVIKNTVDQISRTGVDIVEVGFIRNEPYSEDICVFNSMEQVKKFICPKRKGVEYSVMAEIGHPIPIEMIEPADEDTPEIVRVICWKTKHNDKGETVDALHESYQYCKSIVEKGYQLCVQPNRADQYSDEEFRNMLELFIPLNPIAIYVVDSWGTMYADKVIHYMKIADEVMPKGMAIGYHGHNNLMQAFANTEAVIKENFDRRIIIDASIAGVGRGAGNLNLELVSKYMNEYCGADIDITPMLNIYDRYIQHLSDEEDWGYSLPLYLTANYNANPNYGKAYRNRGITSAEEQEIIRRMSQEERIMYSKELAEKKYDEYIEEKEN